VKTSAHPIQSTVEEEPIRKEGAVIPSGLTDKTLIKRKTSPPIAPTPPSLAWWQADELKDDVAFLAALKIHPDYRHVNLDDELKKSAAHQTKKGRTWSRGFLRSGERTRAGLGAIQ
jgi:hypothetical protein